MRVLLLFIAWIHVMTWIKGFLAWGPEISQLHSRLNRPPVQEVGVGGGWTWHLLLSCSEAQQT